MASKGRTQRKVTDYSGLSDINHVYKRPDTYIGSVKSLKRNVFAMNNDTKKLEKVETTLPEGVERLLLEILSNAGDNTDASRRAGIDPGTIDITANHKTITIKNGGLHIPVKKVTLKEENGNTTVEDYIEGCDKWEWLPVFIFGYFRTSNNYDDKVKRMGAGKNGFGAKLVLIFSKRLSILVEDPDTKTSLEAVWYDNMFLNDRKRKPDIHVTKDSGIKKGSVTISWDLDFERFGMGCYKDEHLDIFRRFAVDFSFACKVKTSFNGEEYDYREISKYATLLWDEEQLKNHFIDYVWEEGADEKIKNAQQKTQEKAIAEAKKPENIPEVEIMVIDTPDKHTGISYVNGLVTIEGGVHVDAALDPVFKKIIDVINKGAKRGKKNNITVKNIKPHISFIVNTRLCDPDYTSQSKHKLVGPLIEVNYKEKNLRKIADWNIIKRLYAELDAMAFLKASKTDGNKRKHVDCENGDDANFAGTKDSMKCVLHLVEGLSAANYPQKRICLMEGGKDVFGYLPMRGKPLNVTNASMLQYAENKVYTEIKKMLGLKEDVDYSIKENLEQLRYGHILMCVDADDDGMHILACVLNFFREKFPGILKRNMIGYLRTPVIKVFKKDKIMKRFFTVKEFETWKAKNDVKGLTVRYYKGLGTSNDKDIEDDLTTAPTVICFYDSKCDENLNLAFHQDLADARKKWIEEWRDVTQIDDVVSMDVSNFGKLKKGQDISQFINRELVAYSVSSLFRAIPSKYDLMKESQRKALWSALEFFKYDPSKGKTIKTGRFANKAADMAQYHHGEKSLTDTIIKMAQDFIGSNNMGYFKKEGQFGTRADGGKNAADARYSEIHLSWWIPYVFKRELVDLVEKRVVDDEPCEPLWIPGVIPMGVVNGTNGIATAFSTTTASYNPLDVIKWLKDRCKGNDFPKPLKPWYNTFEGKIKIEKKTDNGGFVIEGDDEEAIENENVPKRRKDSESSEEDAETEDKAIKEHAKSARVRMKTYGKFDVTGLHKQGGPIIEITEVPVRTWLQDYKKWLQGLVHIKGSKRPVYDFKDNSTTERPKFVIHWNSDYAQPNHRSLHLIKSFGMSNITLIDHKGFPKKYDDIEQVMHEYFDNMLNHYTVVRDKRITNEEEKFRDTSYKIKFISLVLNKEIVIMKVKEDDIKAKMEEHQIPFEYYDKSKSRDFSVESLEKHKKNLQECKERLELAKKVVPQDIWINDLEVLEKELKKRFKNGKFINK